MDIASTQRRQGRYGLARELGADSELEDGNELVVCPRSCEVTLSWWSVVPSSEALSGSEMPNLMRRRALSRLTVTCMICPLHVIGSVDSGSPQVYDNAS